MRGLLPSLVAVVFLLVSAPASAQLFFASRPEPPFTVGPLVIRASVIEGSSAVTVSVLWTLVIPATLGPTDVAQDLYLLWPGEVQGHAAPGKPDPTLARYVEARGFSVIGEGRLGLFARSVSESAVPEPQPGGAPFAVFVEHGGVLGLSPPATLIRVPWTPRLAERGWLLDLRMTVGGHPRPCRPAARVSAVRSPSGLGQVASHTLSVAGDRVTKSGEANWPGTLDRCGGGG